MLCRTFYEGKDLIVLFKQNGEIILNRKNQISTFKTNEYLYGIYNKKLNDNRHTSLV